MTERQREASLTSHSYMQREMTSEDSIPAGNWTNTLVSAHHASHGEDASLFPMNSTWLPQNCSKVPEDCGAADSDFQFWFHGVLSLCLNTGGISVSVLMLPVLVFLFVNEKKNPR